MRYGMGILVVCGIVGLALSVGTAEDKPFDYDRFSFDDSKNQRTVQYFSRSGMTGTQAGLTEKNEKKQIAQRPAANSGQLVNEENSSRYFRNADQQTPPNWPASTSKQKKSSLKNYHRELFGTGTVPRGVVPVAAQTKSGSVRSDSNVIAASHHESAKTEAGSSQSGNEKHSNLIHAEFRKSNNAPKHGEIQQVQSFAEYQSEQNSDSRSISPPPPSFSDDGIDEGHNHSHHDQGNHEESQSNVRFETGFADERISESQSGEFKNSDSPLKLNTISRRAKNPSVTVNWEKRSDINVGQECEFALIVKNEGDSIAKKLTVDAFFPQSIRLTSVEPRPSEATDRLSWDFAELEPGEERSIQIHLIPSKRGELATSATVRFTGSSSSRFNVEEPLLQISMNGPQEVMVGDLASQTVVVSNPGTGVASNVTVEAIIPVGLEHPRGERLMMEIGSLAPGESRMVRLPLAAAEGGKQIITIEAKGNAQLSQTLSREIDVIAPSIRVAVNGPGLRYIGRNAQYTITVTNDGAAGSNNVRVLHRLPHGFKFVRANNGGKFDQSSNTTGWFVGRLDAGESASLRIELSATEPGSFTQRVTAISEHGARSESEFETQVEGSASLVLEIIDLNDPVEVGAETAYEVRVRNEGTAPARNIGISCALPTATEFIGAKGPAEHILENGLVAFRPIAHLDPGKTAVYRIHVSGTAAGNHRFRARLVSDSIQEPLIFEELTKFYDD